MAEVGASDAVKRIRGLSFHENEIDEVANRVMSLVYTLRRTRRLFGHSHLIEMFDYVVRVRFVAYSMENVLETFVVDVAAILQKTEAGFIKRFIRKNFPELYYGFVLKNIKKKILELNFEIFNEFLSRSERRIIINERREASQGQRRLRQTYPRGIGEHFVGMDDELKKLVSLVRERQSPVISIWGETGLGKTTIAAKIYEDRIVIRSFFDAFAWVCLSEGCKISILLLNILSQLISPTKVDKTTQEKTLIGQLSEVQRWKNCLIVLDNVQDMDQWRQLSPALEMESGESVILLTTREENIAKVGFPHKLRLLNEDEAYDLLKKHAFPRKVAPG